MKLYKSCSNLTVELIQYIQENPDTIDHMNDFLERYQDAVFNFIRLNIDNYHDSLELTNKVLLTLSFKVKEIVNAKVFNCMVIKIIKGEINNYWRTQNAKKRKMVKTHESIVSLGVLANDEKASQLFNSLLIREIIEEMLDPYAKDIFFLKYRDGKNVSTIARELGISRYLVTKTLEALHDNLKSCTGE